MSIYSSFDFPIILNIGQYNDECCQKQSTRCSQSQSLKKYTVHVNIWPQLYFWGPPKRFWLSTEENPWGLC